MKLLNITIKTIVLLFVVLVSCKVACIKNDVVVNELILLDEEQGVSMESFKENHFISKSNQLLKRAKILDTLINSFEYDGTSSPIELATIVNFYVKDSDLDYEEVVIEDGYPVGRYSAGVYGADDVLEPYKTMKFKNGNVSGAYRINNTKDSLLYQTNFKRGDGYWKDYYLSESKIREEGQVRNNCKDGTWKYYNLSGEIDSTKSYTLQDSIDVRYPHCLFN